MLPWRSAARFGGAPTMLVEVSRYWVSSPFTSEEGVERLVAGGWDETEQPGERGKTRVLVRQRFPYAVDAGRLVFAVKSSGISSGAAGWWDAVDLAQNPSEGWSDAVGPRTISYSSARWRRQKAHFRILVTESGRQRPVRLRHVYEDSEAADLWSLLTEVYPRYSGKKKEVFVAEECPPEREWT